MRTFLTILAALLVVGGTGYYLMLGLRPAPVPVAEAAATEVRPPLQVFAPAAALAAGTILLPEHLSRIALDSGSVTDEMIVADEEGRALLIGSVARHALPRAVPIARSAVVQPGERGFLAAVLPQGKRAISIPVSEVAGLSGLVMPGDRVDIILTYSISGVDIDAERDVRASETVLSNLRVLALDQRLQEADPARSNDPGARPVARTATLEVAPREAEMLTLANQLGELSLVLNALEDGGPSAELPIGTVAPSRPLTLDSHVTSLLLRERTGGEGDQITSLAERLSRVQVVRGVDSQAQDVGVDALVSPSQAASRAPRSTTALVGAARALAATAAPPD